MQMIFQVREVLVSLKIPDLGIQSLVKRVDLKIRVI